jgi:hypothetical protein
MFKLSPEAEAEIQRARALELSQRETFQSMTDASLVASAKFWMQHCVSPRKYVPEEPIYDSTFWHAIVPELIRRLEKK